MVWGLLGFAGLQQLSGKSNKKESGAKLSDGLVTSATAAIEYLNKYFLGLLFWLCDELADEVLPKYVLYISSALSVFRRLFG